MSESGLGYFAVAKEVEGINFTRSTEQQQEISDILELGTRRVNRQIITNETSEEGTYFIGNKLHHQQKTLSVKVPVQQKYLQ